MQHAVVYTNLNSVTVHGKALEQNLVATAVVMGWDYDGDVAMSGSCVYCCADTSEVLCTLLVSHLYRLYSDVVCVSLSWVHYPRNVYSSLKCFPPLGFETESSLLYFFATINTIYSSMYKLILFRRHVYRYFVNNSCQSFNIRGTALEISLRNNCHYRS